MYHDAVRCHQYDAAVVGDKVLLWAAGHSLPVSALAMLKCISGVAIDKIKFTTTTTTSQLVVHT